MNDVPLREHIEALFAEKEKALAAALASTEKAAELALNAAEKLTERIEGLERTVSNLEGRALILATSAGLGGIVIGGLVSRLIGG